MTTSTLGDSINYDPYDFEVDADPYPTFRRLRDEAPIYYNRKYDFYALSRYDDIKKASLEWQIYQSGHGSVLELIKSGAPIPPGFILFEDPPVHDLHRGLLARVFTMRRIAEIEPKVRAFCVATLDPLIDHGSFDFVADFGSEIPMRTIGMMLGIPDADQPQHRQRIDEGFKLDSGDASPDGSAALLNLLDAERFGSYIDYRQQHPADDVMTDLLNATYTDTDGREKRLDKVAIQTYVGLLAAAGNETTVRLIGWAGKVLAEHPDQRRQLAENPSLIPGAIEELLRYEAPSPVQARYVAHDVEHYGTTVPQGSVMLLLTASANRDERMFADPDRFDIHRKARQHLAFGFGIHHCLGAHLARLEARVALEEVLKRFPEWEVDWDNAVQAHTSTVRGWERLPVITGTVR
ncbi:cytochrome P450 [Mycobacterium branderi]|uniref:Cytochrome n=1 Tax=Mycobacterium branderi TaxID=43348 RepID=A0A7I7WFY0_9MYCO|nr:cytochrome P450 [Mycobacterium branderi]MCV7231638.1 cytochrome P450 [Mycobacterium branderi]ORA40376.1 cytochrome [Mycobacterium branderi]BBZ14878.1 cytochrome P450 [Mycobacterium branderi]